MLMLTFKLPSEAVIDEFDRLVSGGFLVFVNLCMK